jgi:hypothetical protein
MLSAGYQNILIVLVDFQVGFSVVSQSILYNRVEDFV